MDKCALCPGYINDDEETASFYLNPEDEEKSVAHLKCFIGKYFVVTSTFECTLSDVVVVSAFEVCAWCRMYGLVVAHMPRTGQAICNRCSKIIEKLLSESDAKQILLSNLDSSKSTVLKIIEPKT